MLFKEFGGVERGGDGGQGDAVQGVRRRRRVADLPRHEGRRRDRRRSSRPSRPGFGGINLEDIAAPRCFEIERRLQDELDIPVFHDDQHGTAVVVLAALINALKLVGKQASDVRVVMVGVGAAGIAVADMLAAHGVTRPHRLRPQGRRLRRPRGARRGAPARSPSAPTRAGSPARSPRRSPAPTSRSGCPGPGAISADAVRTMADRAIVFAMANPTPEVQPEDVARRRRGHRHRPLRLPEPDQQRARLPRHLPRRARRARADDQRGDEAGRRRGDRLRHRRGRAARRLRHPERLQPPGHDAVAAAWPRPRSRRASPPGSRRPAEDEA